MNKSELIPARRAPPPPTSGTSSDTYSNKNHQDRSGYEQQRQQRTDHTTTTTTAKATSISTEIPTTTTTTTTTIISASRWDFAYSETSTSYITIIWTTQAASGKSMPSKIHPDLKIQQGTNNYIKSSGTDANQVDGDAKQFIKPFNLQLKRVSNNWHQNNRHHLHLNNSNKTYDITWINGYITFSY